MYIARYIKDYEAFLECVKNGELEKLEVANYPWGGEYTPEVYAVLAHDQNGICVYMHAYDNDIRIKVTEHNGRICTDSCMEFFFIPSPEQDERYYNFEVNAAGVMHIAIGEGRHNRTLLPEDNVYFKMNANIAYGAEWSVAYYIPYAFIEKHSGVKMPENYSIKANLYKCGDGCAIPHYGTHFPVGTQRPDFHRPEYFGDIEFR